jgi:hypothetical protein
VGFVWARKALNGPKRRFSARAVSWWNSLPSVEQNSLANINRLVSVGEDIKMNELNAWADASRQKKPQKNDDKYSVSEHSSGAHHSGDDIATATPTPEAWGA